MVKLLKYPLYNCKTFLKKFEQLCRFIYLDQGFPKGGEN